MAYRFIPVYTGNTAESPCRTSSGSVYPCVYREHDHNFRQSHFDSGLSLCIQGTRVVMKLARAILRFIPVYTGNTQPSMSFIGANTVYPCVYREHSKYI